MMIAQASIENLPIESNSIDLIFTDPPYPREYLHTYGWLANEAMRVLKPGGFVLAMCGGAYINQIFRMFDGCGLDFFWQYQLEEVGNKCGVYWHHGTTNFPIVIRHKQLICYSKGMSLPQTATTSLIKSNGADKRYHHWGQNVSSARYCVEAFSRPGDLVLDPFIGGGTTAVACELIGRRCVAFDIDPVAVNTTRARLVTEEIPIQAGMFAV